MRALMVGRSEESACSVRDDADLLAPLLQESGIAVSTVWPSSPPGSHGPSINVGKELSRRCRQQRPDVLLLNYSVIRFSRRGIPTGVPGLVFRVEDFGPAQTLMTTNDFFRTAHDLIGRSA